MKHAEIQSEMKTLHCCVIIPTYNNDRFIRSVIESTLHYTEDIIVVNDGSTDSTGLILRNMPVEVLSFPKNRGKGFALRAGFRLAKERGFRYAITLDSDGQHDPADIPRFLEKLRDNPGSLIVGARNMDQEGIPSKSSFGHRFSNFWYHLETGIALPDTQSGFRLYPLEELGKMRFFSRRYEFEIEILVRAAWKGISVLHVPVSVDYNPEGERITHFRPFIDFSRVSILNTILVPLALLYYRPKMFIRGLSRKSIREFFRKEVLGSSDSNLKLALSVVVGIFMGIAPIWGWQLVTAIFLSFLLRLNKVIVIIAANISLPPMIPLIIYLSFKIGGFVLGKGSETVSYSSGFSFDMITDDFYQYIIGALSFGTALSISLGLITFLLLALFRKRKPVLKQQPE
ncbi:MAG: DUF2062 domain-containing protein [Bacteroidetes bacterium]|nr:DUF2062 domain-containing protein [Bacteroidota bacterium]